MSASIIQVGRNCWRQEPANRVALLVDAGSYFETLSTALQGARHSVWIVGWDIHSRVCLVRDRGGVDSSFELAKLLDRITQNQPDLEVRILIWNPAPIYLLEREFSPLLQFSFRTGPRVQFRLASDHVTGASHHQKLVVIDERVAFVGGIDLTAARWDTPDHEAEDPRRRMPSGQRFGPFHDVQLAVDGAAAGALAELARQRWEQATGEPIEPVTAGADSWPESLTPHLTAVRIAFARTQANYNGRGEIREVETLYLDAIAAARQTIYIENQYITSTSICEALCDRLSDPRGPEVLIVTPKEQSGRLERSTMGTLRTRVLRELKQADAHDHLRVFSPLVGEDIPVNVHAKVMFVDDRFLRVGSANLSNRSMGLDTELDAAIEAQPEERDTRNPLRRLRDGLLAEHLGIAVEKVQTEVGRRGSLLEAVDFLCGGEGRRLEKLDIDVLPEVELADVQFVDPDGPLTEALARKTLFPETSDEARRRIPRLATALALALGLAALWATVADWPAAGEIANSLGILRERIWGPPIAAVMLAVAATLLPINLLIVASVLLFGPWMGTGVSLTGSLLGASTGYTLGRLLWRDAVQKLAGKRIDQLARSFATRGIMTVIVMRMVPIAPFTITNLVAGSLRIGFRDFLLGTLIAMTPGILVLSFASDRLIAAVRNPSTATVLGAAGALLLMGIGMFLLSRFLRRRSAAAQTTANNGA